MVAGARYPAIAFHVFGLGYPFTLLPHAPSLHTLQVNDAALAVLLAIDPLASVDAPVRPSEDPFAVFGVLRVASGVCGTIGPPPLAQAIHVALVPLAGIHPAVSER